MRVAVKVAAPALPRAPAWTWGRALDYLELTKPRVAVLVLFTVAIGGVLAAGGLPNLVILLHALVGTALVAAGASALNQWLERGSDALMRRTENRPLPSGRLAAGEVFAFGIALGVIGVTYLAVALPRPVAALVAAFTYLSYVFVYTPLKRKTVLNTLVGAIPGALPPVIGWTALRGTFDGEAASLFAILFVWQVPHFLAIAWIYRDDYARARLRMLPVLDRDGCRTGWHMVGFCLLLLLASLLPAARGLVGPIYLVGAVVLGLAFLGSAVAFWRCPSMSQARRVLQVSLLYLPGLLTLLVIDGWSSPVALALWP